MASARRTPPEPPVPDFATRSPGSDVRAHRAVYLAACALAGVLLVLSYPRYGLDWLVWIAFAPFFWAVTGAGWRRGLIGGFIAGVILEACGFSWVLDAMMNFTGLGLAGGLAMYTPWVLYETVPWAALGLCLGLQRTGDRPLLAGALVAIPLWIALEHYYPRVFPWHVGVALGERISLVQAADLLGASGLTAVILLVNVVFTFALFRVQRLARFPAASAAAAAVILVAANIYGAVRLAEIDRTLLAAAEIHVGMIQPVTRPEERARQPAVVFSRMTQFTQVLQAKEPLDLILWPEGADTIGFRLDGRGRVGRPAIAGDIATFEWLAAPLVAGTWVTIPSSGAVYNSAAYILPRTWPPAGFYYKNIRLLFGEYVPFLDNLPAWLRERIGYVGTITAGTESPAFMLPGSVGDPAPRFRILICYEGILADYVRRSAAGADFLVNITEDIWYGDTSHIGQHLQVLRIRAIESRIAIARATNIGPSGVIDPAGRMPAATTKFTRTARAFSLRPARFESFYTRAGHYFPLFCLGLGLAGVAWLRFRATRRPGT
ncbi:MAG TPA: apolipoprotein N-acyltransferase [Burkholderiales bacterium]|nr:apolipoprotein N-acyltransferase [Burkholderiales bacterium]